MTDIVTRGDGLKSLPQSDSVTASMESMLGKVADEFTQQLNRGEQPDVEDYCVKHPQIAHVLRQVLPALQLIRIPASGDDSAESIQGTLGDFRILREVGRGGMGIVYEAEQISLGRRVALKVLPFAGALDNRQLQRFKNEAHAAAHLQHTNIVPVYFVGCERGVHFYAMQYVEGQTLAQLIAELRQQRSQESGIRGQESQIRAGSMSDRLAGDSVAGLSEAGYKPGALGAGLPTPPKSATEGLPEPTGSYLPSDGSASAIEKKPTTPEPLSTINDQAAATETAPTPPRSSILDSPSSFFRSVAHLGIQAAEALEHAHQLGVIHRDIKPSNLLVENSSLSAPSADATRLATWPSPLTPDPSPLRLWITDFGLAHCQGACELTMSGDLLGTLRYMSPEQALAKRVIVDERTDIYSLGVTLYELLTLEPAFPGTDRQEILRRIAFEDPKPPRRWNKSIPAELETIVLKAIEKSPADRYATAQDLADDLRRYLEDKPIRARRPTLVQRARKWTRRHSAVVRATLVTAFLALTMSTILVWRQWQFSENHRKQSVKSAAKAEAMNDFLVKIVLGTGSGDEARGNKVTLDDVMQAAAAKIDGAFPDQPEVEADVRIMIGESFLSMGLQPKAQPHFERALDLRKRVLGEDNLDTLVAMRTLAKCHSQQGHSADAARIFQEVLAKMRRILRDDDPALLDLLNNLGWNLLHQGRWSEAASVQRECLQKRLVLDPVHEDTLDVMCDLACTLANEGTWDEAEKLAREGLRLHQINFGEDARTFKAACKLAFVLIREGKGHEAESIARKWQKIGIQIWGPDNPEALAADELIIGALWTEDTPPKLDEAEQVCRRNLKVLLATPELNQHLIEARRLELGWVLWRQGNWPDAVSVLQPNLEGLGRVFGEQHPFAFWGQFALASVLEATSNSDDAGTHFQKAIAGMRKIHSPQHFLALALYEWAEHLLDQRDWKQAEEALQEISRIPRQSFPPGDLRPLGQSLAALGWVLTKEGRAKEGEPFLKQGLDICKKYFAENHWATAEAKSRLGGCLAAQSQFSEAEKLLETSYESLDTARGVPPQRKREGLERVIQLYELSGQPDKAAQWRAKRTMPSKAAE